jgi:GH18 family chitinase
LKEFRQAINDEAYAENRDPLIMSVAVAAGKKRIDQGYEVNKIVSELDFINIMTYV